MQIHVNGTHRYASTQPFTIGADGKKRYAHKHWGTLDENLRFHFPIPDCCAPIYVSKAKQTTRRRGRPAKPKVEKRLFSTDN